MRPISEDTMQLPWKRLIRFEAADGRILRGEPILPFNDYDVGFVQESDNLQARVIIGDDIFNTNGTTTVSNEIVKVRRLLGPLAQADVPIVRCVGLNYAKHSEASRSIDKSSLTGGYAFSQGSWKEATTFPLHLL